MRAPGRAWRPPATSQVRPVRARSPANASHDHASRNLRANLRLATLDGADQLAPVRLLTDLKERGIHWVAIDHDSYLVMGCNILAVRPGVVVMVDGVPAVRRALERVGIEVHVYDGSELSLKGDGGPTCLTAPLLRR